MGLWRQKKNQCSSRPELESSFYASSFPVISSAVNTLLKDRSTGTASHAVMAEKARLPNLAENLHSPTPKCGTRRKGPELQGEGYVQASISRQQQTVWNCVNK